MEMAEIKVVEVSYPPCRPGFESEWKSEISKQDEEEREAMIFEIHFCKFSVIY